MDLLVIGDCNCDQSTGGATEFDLSMRIDNWSYLDAPVPPQTVTAPMILNGTWLLTVTWESPSAVDANVANWACNFKLLVHWPGYDIWGLDPDVDCYNFLSKNNNPDPADTRNWLPGKWTLERVTTYGLEPGQLGNSVCGGPADPFIVYDPPSFTASPIFTLARNVPGSGQIDPEGTETPYIPLRTPHYVVIRIKGRLLTSKSPWPAP